MPHFMACVGRLADRLWHNGGLYTERPVSSTSSRAVITLQVPALPQEKPVIKVQRTPTTTLHPSSQTLTTTTIPPSR